MLRRAALQSRDRRPSKSVVSSLGLFSFQAIYTARELSNKSSVSPNDLPSASLLKLHSLSRNNRLHPDMNRLDNLQISLQMQILTSKSRTSVPESAFDLASPSESYTSSCSISLSLLLD